jgi:hypothetical protein
MDRRTGICTRTGQRLTINQLGQCLNQGFEEWKCGKESILSPAIHTTGLKFATGSTYVDKLLVIYLLTGGNTGHTTHKGVMDEMATMNAIAKNGLIHETDGVAPPPEQCMQPYGESVLLKAYYSLHPAARYCLEQVHTDYITARTEADRLQGKLISLWVNSNVSKETLAEGMLGFPSVFAGGKIDADYLQNAVDIIEGSISLGYGMVVLCKIGSDMASALMDAETSSGVEDGELANVLEALGIQRGMGSSIFRGMLWSNGANVIRAEDGTCFAMGVYQ